MILKSLRAITGVEGLVRGGELAWRFWESVRRMDIIATSVFPWGCEGLSATMQSRGRGDENTQLRSGLRKMEQQRRQRSPCIYFRLSARTADQEILVGSVSSVEDDRLNPVERGIALRRERVRYIGIRERGEDVRGRSPCTACRAP